MLHDREDALEVSQEAFAKVFTNIQQFKEEAMRLVMERSYTPTSAARELGIPINTLNQWLKKAGWRPSTKEQVLPAARIPHTLGQVREEPAGALNTEEAGIRKACTLH